MLLMFDGDDGGRDIFDVDFGHQNFDVASLSFCPRYFVAWSGYNHVVYWYAVRAPRLGHKVGDR